MRPETAGGPFAGEQVRGSRILGQAVPGDLGVTRRPGGGGVDLAGDVTLERMISALDFPSLVRRSA